MMMPAPTPEEIFTNTEVSWPRRDAVPVLGQRAEVGVVLDVHGDAEPLLGDRAGVDVLPAREDGRGPDHVVGHRRGQPEADVAHGPVHPSHRVQHRAGQLQGLGVAVAGGRGPGAPRRAGDRSGRRRATATWLWPKSTPATSPASRARRTAEPRRPLPGSASTSRDAVSSRTMLETVAGARPVARASSAWVNADPVSPSSSGATGVTPRSTSRTRRWFAVRSEEVDPGAGVDTVGAHGGESCTRRTSVVKR